MKLKELGGPLHLIEVHTPLQTLGAGAAGSIQMPVALA
jgi:hypothetical protein